MVDEDLEPLITRCPNCSTQFRVTESQLAAAGGRVRCGACLTVFEGTDHLILDEAATFSDGMEADAALDALLDELGSGESESPDPSAGKPPDQKAAQTLTDDSPVIYGGFEDEPAAENGALAAAAGAEADDAADAQAVEPELLGVGSEAGAEAGDEAGRAEAERDESEQATPSADLDLKADTAEREADSGGAPEADYKAWIRPGTPEIEQMVDEVFSSAAAPVADASEVEAAPAAEEPQPRAVTEPADAADFHLSAVEKSLEEEGVGTSPISFAPEPRRWWVVGAAAGLSLLLAAQLFYLLLPEWSRDPGTRGFYESVCGLVGCELPEIRDLEGLRTRNLNVRSHEALENALTIDVVIVNQAAFEQRFPGLELRFTSVGGLLVAGRVFEPEEYLAGDEIGPADLMPVNTPIQVSLNIADPGEEAVNYTLSFR